MSKTESKYQSLRPSELALYHKNPRVGDVEAIAASLRAHGQYAPIIVNIGTHTDRPYEVLKGNHTLKAFRNLAERFPDDDRWQSIECRLLDVDDDQAARIVAVDNRTSELGSFDEKALAELLSGLGDDLTGTGYSAEDLSDLESLIQETNEDLDVDPFGSDSPEPESNGLIDTKDVEEQGDAYAETATRMIILSLPISQFVWAQEKLAAYRSNHGLDSNSDALIHWLEQESGESAPDRDDEVSDDQIEAAEQAAV